MMKIIDCNVNGRDMQVAVDERESLADMLRNRLGLTSVKKGCEVGEWRCMHSVDRRPSN